MDARTDTVSLDTLLTFGRAMHEAFVRRADALFELTDALQCAGMVRSLPPLSVEAAPMRGWGGLYDALAAGRISTAAVAYLLAAHPSRDGKPIDAVDASVWARCDADASLRCGLYYHPSRHAAGQPIVAGWAFQWIAQLSFAPDRRTVTLGVRRLDPHDNPNRVAAAEIAAVRRWRDPRDDSLPIFVGDAVYDPVRLGQALEETRAAPLGRLRAGRCFSADPLRKGNPGPAGPGGIATSSLAPPPPPGWLPRTTAPRRIRGGSSVRRRPRPRLGQSAPQAPRACCPRLARPEPAGLRHARPGQGLPPAAPGVAAPAALAVVAWR